MTLHLHDPVDPEAGAVFAAHVAAYGGGKPVSKIIGGRLFWGRSFAVTGDVLDPRDDTEALVAACLKHGPQRRVLDLGTGTGILGLTLAAEWPEAEGLCTDISEAALEVARGTARRLGVDGQVRFMRSDWLDAVTGRFDLIVCNPPYIALDEWDGLEAQVRRFDPRGALTDEADGLSVYRRLAARSGAYLHSGGLLALEIGWQQGARVRQLLQDAGFADVRILPDMAGRDRCVLANWP